MKRLGDIMEEMGFRKEAPDSLKEAFVRHLIKASTGTEVPPRETPEEKKKKIVEEVQLCFSFLDEDLSGKKVG